VGDLNLVKHIREKRLLKETYDHYHDLKHRSEPPVHYSIELSHTLLSNSTRIEMLNRREKARMFTISNDSPEL